MDKTVRYDAHCHIFTLDYALKEAKNMYRDIKNGSYPFSKPAAASLSADSRTASSGRSLSFPDWWELLQLLKQFFELMHAAFGSEEENLDFLQSEAKKAYKKDTPCIVPLMMDIYYMLAYPLEAGKDVVAMDKSLLKNVSDSEIEKGWSDMMGEFSKFLAEKKQEPRIQSSSALVGLVDKAISLVESERNGMRKNLSATAQGYSEDMDFHKTDGFCFHMDNLMALVSKRPGELFPFVAIDPRRPGIVDTLCSGAFLKGDPCFYGVKLYPRMGFHPLSKPMFRVYEYCNENKLPITFHCGMGGFPPSTTWIYTQFGNPANFEPVLKQYPNLRIDFAHMGSSDTSHEWADEVARLVNTYDNAFTDLSCYTVADELPPMKKYWDDNPKLQNRLMFGTDFDVMYFTAEITMQQYYKNFNKVFSKADMERMMHDNPASFMQAV